MTERAQPTPGAHGGWGLRIVDQLADDWGVLAGAPRSGSSSVSEAALPKGAPLSSGHPVSLFACEHGLARPGR
jgi:hypothetical protein